MNQKQCILYPVCYTRYDKIMSGMPDAYLNNVYCWDDYCNFINNVYKKYVFPEATFYSWDYTTHSDIEFDQCMWIVKQCIDLWNMCIVNEWMRKSLSVVITWSEKKQYKHNLLKLEFLIPFLNACTLCALSDTITHPSHDSSSETGLKLYLTYSVKLLLQSKEYDLSEWFENPQELIQWCDIIYMYYIIVGGILCCGNAKEAVGQLTTLLKMFTTPNSFLDNVHKDVIRLLNSLCNLIRVTSESKIDWPVFPSPQEIYDKIVSEEVLDIGNRCINRKVEMLDGLFIGT